MPKANVKQDAIGLNTDKFSITPYFTEPGLRLPDRLFRCVHKKTPWAREQQEVKKKTKLNVFLDTVLLNILISFIGSLFF